MGPDMPSCKHSLDVFVDMCNEVGVPLAPDKTLGPAKGFVDFSSSLFTSVQPLKTKMKSLRSALSRALRSAPSGSAQ